MPSLCEYRDGMCFCMKPEDWDEQYRCLYSPTEAARGGNGLRCKYQREAVSGLGATCWYWKANDEAYKK